MVKNLFLPQLTLAVSAFLFSSSGLSEESYPARLLWGDTHLHTSFSADAYIAGNRSVGPDDAYRFAKGEPIAAAMPDVRVQLRQPLDFLAVADHAEGLGLLLVYDQEDVPQPDASWFEATKASIVRWLFRRSIADPAEAGEWIFGRMSPPQVHPGDDIDPLAIDKGTARPGLSDAGILQPSLANEMSASKWRISMEAADRHNDPGTFTALVGWEWTQTGHGVNLHRVIISDAAGSVAAGIDPFGADDGKYPEQLWQWLDKTSTEIDADFVSIPHNSNLSKGYMFAESTLTGKPMDAEYIALRSRWETTVEITQFKGDSEVHPDLAPDDEFADFEPFNFYLQKPPQGGPQYPYKAGKGDYVRSALKTGLEIEQIQGANPFKFGLIGSTDSHTGISSAAEPYFWAKVSQFSPLSNKRRNGEESRDVFNDWNMSASGLAAVWAHDNTRKEVVAAFKRRETYATTGPRIRVRVFAGWEFDDEDAEQKDIATIGYLKGVPMGGDLTNAPEGAVLQLLIRAVRGPWDHNLDRAQVIKGWLDSFGQAQEKVFDVVWSDGRQFDPTGKLPAVGHTVDLLTGFTSNSIGAPELSKVWRDPEFDASQRAFYYVRVLQIPTIRHSKLDANALGLETPSEGPATLQERAYTSPIWYTP